MPKENEYYEKLKELTESNIEGVKSKYKDVVMPRSDLDDSKSVEKKVGITVGKFLTLKDGGVDVLLKKSARYRSHDEQDHDTKSSDMDLKENVRNSFLEKFGSSVFAELKKIPNFLPKIYLVSSNYNKVPQKIHNKLPEKIYNKFKKNNIKVYTASEIIGDVARVNEHKRDIGEIFMKKPENKTKLDQEILEDLCENVLIMAITANYDIKFDNFVIKDNQAVPIDFGNCQHEDKLSPDMMAGLEFIRGRQDSISSNLINNIYLEEKQGNVMYKSFYNKFITPEHLIKLSKKINQDKEITEDLVWKNSYIYTFGAHEEKVDSANNMIARVRNFVKLQPFLESWKLNNYSKVSTFENKNIRDIISKDELFREGSKNIYIIEFISDYFEVLKDAQKNLLTLLSSFQESSENDQKEVEENIHTSVANSNQRRNVFFSECQLKFEELESKYKFLQTKNKTSPISLIANIKNATNELIEILKEPLIEDVTYGESLSVAKRKNEDLDDYLSNLGGSFNISFSNNLLPGSPQRSDCSKDDSLSEGSNENSESEVFDSELETSVAHYRWDLSKSSDYIEKIEEVLDLVNKNSTNILNNLYLLATHIKNEETLSKVKEDNFYKRVFLDKKILPSSSSKNANAKAALHKSQNQIT